MLAPPTFGSTEEQRAVRGDVGFWWPYVGEVLRRHALTDAGLAPVAGYNPTCPTFLYGDVVVKLFGLAPGSRRSHRAERAAYRLLATDPEIRAPGLVAEGQLFDDDEPWPYLVTTRISGVSSFHADMSRERRLSVAEELGRQVRRVHALVPADVPTDADWPPLDVVAAARRSSLPPHLIAQVDSYLQRLQPFERVFVHGDLVAAHVFVDDGPLSGIIDWGDAVVTDRHYELIQVYRDMFACDASLFRVFLEASEWPVGDGFTRQAMGMALYRQAVGIAEHGRMDAFEPVAERFPLKEIATLEELAETLFGV